MKTHRFSTLIAMAISGITISSVMPGAAGQSPFPEINIAATDVATLPKEVQDIVKLTWEVPSLLATLDITKKDDREITPAMEVQVKTWDETFLSELGLKGVALNKSIYGEATAGVDVLRTQYQGVIPFETRNSVWVWSVWLPVAEILKQNATPESVGRILEQSGLVRSANLKKPFEENGNQFYSFERTEWAGKPANRVEMVVNKAGILLWRLKRPKDGNTNNEPTIISSQLAANRGWFSSMGKLK